MTETLAAIRARDSRYDGLFVYAVKTTGVYCRPSCPSRQANSGNISIYSDAAEARAAGFRPCRRCAPDQSTGDRDARKAVIEAACRQISEADEPVPLFELARDAGLTTHQFSHLFKEIVGISPGRYGREVRRARIRKALASGSHSVTAAIHDAGYGSAGRFYSESTEALGMSPSIYKAGGKGMRITAADAKCSLGRILVATTPKGICAIALGDDSEQLFHDLTQRFPNADIVRDAARLKTSLERVVAFIDTPGSALDLPLDIRGTAFQNRVWRALQQVPSGQTVTYTEIAQRLGQPTAARAVAAACAANPVAVVVPCHRVVRSDGALSGYRWGVDRKRKLLEREAEAGDAAVVPNAPAKRTSVRPRSHKRPKAKAK